MFQILVVEDDSLLRQLYCSVLERNGYTTLAARDGLEAFDILEEHHADAVITDIMMPRMDGMEFLRSLRQAQYTMPVLIITASQSLAYKQMGFHLGTDDYMVKPIDVNEMVWRIQALLRRSRMVSSRSVCLGSTRFSLDNLSVSWPGTVLELPQKEFLLLFKLVSEPNRIFTRHQILADVWDDEGIDSHTLDVHISRLRERLRQNPDFEIVTIRGLGYKAVMKE